MAILKTYREICERKDEEYVYYAKESSELWLSYGQGSGQTAQLSDTKRYLNSDNSDKEHYDSLVQKISGASLSNKLLKSKSNIELYEINVYSIKGTYDIWGGDVKPVGKMFIMITKEKSTIINIFEKKNAALNWFNSIT